MTLAERIFTLRTQKKLSQGDLAELLEVSRQSVSKWETGTSTPDLDKLVAMSSLFGVTLDYLAKGDGDVTAAPEAAPAMPGAAPAGIRVQQAIGLVLLAVGLLATMLALLLNGAGLLILSIPLMLCGILCLIVRRGAWIYIGWGVLLLVFYFSPRLLGLSPLAVFHAGALGGDWSILRFYSLQLIFCIAFWLCFLLLFFFTLRRIRRARRVRILPNPVSHDRIDPGAK